MNILSPDNSYLDKLDFTCPKCHLKFEKVKKDKTIDLINLFFRERILEKRIPTECKFMIKKYNIIHLF